MSSRLREWLLTILMFIALVLGSVVAYAGSVTYTYDGLNRLIRAEYEDGTVIQYTYDSAGNRITLYVSTTPPTTAASPAGGTYEPAQSVTVTCTDWSGSGCDKTYYTTDSSTPTTSSAIYSSPINISVTTTLKFFSTDLAGNSEAVQTEVYTIVDTIPPTTTPSPAGGTYNLAQSVTLTCTDGSESGCDKIYYTTDGATPTTESPIYSSPINISETTTLKFFSKDLAGNSESVKTEIYTIDTTAPTGTITINSGAASTGSVDVTLTLTCEDAQGCSEMKFSNDVDSDPNYSTPETYSATKAWVLSSGDGTKTVYAKFKDTTGNWSTAYGDTINLTYTKSLLHMNGADGSTTFTDAAIGGSHTWTASGNGQIDTAQSKFGGASGLFDGNGDYLQTPYSSDFDFGADDLTWDFWVRFSSLPVAGGSYALITVARRTDNNNVNVIYLNNGSGVYKLYFVAIVGGVVQAVYSQASGWAVSTGMWYHIAVVRSGSNFYIFVNGVSQSLTMSTPVGSNSITPAVNEATSIGRYGNYTGYDLNGWMDEVRISKGIARWTSNFTPPSEEY